MGSINKRKIGSWSWKIGRIVTNIENESWAKEVPVHSEKAINIGNIKGTIWGKAKEKRKQLSIEE